MAMTIVEAARAVTGGVDTHLDVHVAAALDPVGGLLGTEGFTADPAGYKAMLSWLEGFGEVAKVGMEGTGSYGAGLARFLRHQGIGPSRASRAKTVRIWLEVSTPPATNLHDTIRVRSSTTEWNGQVRWRSQ